jgi:hypothetical protein
METMAQSAVSSTNDSEWGYAFAVRMADNFCDKHEWVSPKELIYWFCDGSQVKFNSDKETAEVLA